MKADWISLRSYINEATLSNLFKYVASKTAAFVTDSIHSGMESFIPHPPKENFIRTPRMRFSFKSPKPLLQYLSQGANYFGPYFIQNCKKVRENAKCRYARTVQTKAEKNKLDLLNSGRSPTKSWRDHLLVDISYFGIIRPLPKIN